MLVGVGGFLGSAGRYLVSGWVYRLMPATGFPWGTLVVNLTGCLAIGLLGGLAEARQIGGAEFRLVVMIGVLGGFTTFSTFAYETLALSRDAELLPALANVAAQVVLGLGAAWLAYGFVRG